MEDVEDNVQEQETEDKDGRHDKDSPSKGPHTKDYLSWSKHRDKTAETES